MKNKKLFAILTLVAFMLTMMPVMAFATTADDVYVWVEDGSAIANNEGNQGKAIAYIDFDELKDDERIFVYTVKGGQVYEDLNMNNKGKGWLRFSNNESGETKIEMTSEDPVTVTLKAVLVKDIVEDDENVKDLTIHQVNKGAHEGFDFFAIDVEDASIAFKSTADVPDNTFEVVNSTIAYKNSEDIAVNAAPAQDKEGVDIENTAVLTADEALAANGGVDYYKVKVKLARANGDAVKNEEVTVDMNKIGVAVSETELTTNNRGIVEFNVYATKVGTYELTLTADDSEDFVITVSFGDTTLGAVKVNAQPTGATATGSTAMVFLTVTDVNGNVLTGDTALEKLVAGRDIKIVKVPADCALDEDVIIGGAKADSNNAWFGLYNNKPVLNVKMSDAGDYTLKLYAPATGSGVEYVYVTFAKFDKAVSATVTYDAATYMLGAEVEEPTVNVFDANGVKKAANSVAFSYTGVGVVGFDKTDGTFTVSNDDKYLGQQIIVNVVADKCFATTTLNIADVPAYLQFDAANAAVGTAASVTVKSLDLKGNVAALGQQYTIDEVSYVVTSKPEGAIVSVDATALENADNANTFITKGTESISIASNKEGTVTVNVVVEASKECTDRTHSHDGQAEEPRDTIFLTGIATVDFGGKVTTVSSSATLIIGSNVFVANGGVLTAPVAPAIVDGRTYLPIRALSQALGANVDYADGVVTIKLGNTVATMTVGSNVMTVGAETVQIDAAPYVVDGTTMVPLRAAATALGYDIDVTYNVDGTVATVTVYKK